MSTPDNPVVEPNTGNNPNVFTSRKIVANNVVNGDTGVKGHPNYGYAGNGIRTTKYTLLTFVPKNLFEQFHRFANLYFLGIQILNWIPGITAFGRHIQLMPLVFVLGVTAVKDLFEDRRRHRSDKAVNSRVCRKYDRITGRFVSIKWADVRVGDIVHLSCNETVPADILILSSSDDSGLCYVETCNLDGENNLKQRQVIKGYSERPKPFKPMEFTGTIECDPPNSQIYRFNGFITETNGQKLAINKDNLLLRDCILKNTDFIDGIVVYAGHDTKAMLNNGGPRSKRSKLEKVMNRDVIWCVILLLLMCITGSIGCGFWLTTFDSSDDLPFIPGDSDRSPAWNGFTVFWTFIILYQAIIPVSLYVTVELIKCGQVYHIHEDKALHDPTSDKAVFCRALNITEDLGQIEYIFSDKTGTLTENRMIFRRCSIGGIDYSHKKPEDSDLNIEGEEKPEFLLNSHLVEELSLMSTYPSNGAKNSYKLSEQSQRIQDFFILLAVCNSAVASRHPHKDKMTQSGQYLERSDSESTMSTVSTKSSALSNLFGLKDLLISPTKKERSRSVSPMPLKPIYESESPDEVALVGSAFRYNIKLLKRNADKVVVSLPSEGIIEFSVLNILPFDSTRKKMSIILRHPTTNQIILFCKGSDSAILQSLAKTTDPHMKRMIEITEKQLNIYSRKGLRTLCMSKRILTEEEYKKWNDGHKKAEQSLEDNEKQLLESHNRIEINLELMGATGIEDSLQERVPEVIANLRMAGIVVWVLTGDKLETAVNIAYSCSLFTKNMEIIYLKIKTKEQALQVLNKHLEESIAKVPKKSAKPEMSPLKRLVLDTFLIGSRFGHKTEQIPTEVRSKRGIVIDGKALALVLQDDTIEMFLALSQYCSSVLCCRATPLQKSQVVRSVKENLDVMTLAIGDGANDVSMIQTADVGIGISGQEGTQAVMASDFAIPRFLYLERLLLVHGSRSYYRLAQTILYFFYKNASSVFTILWFQFFCGFSGGVMIDQLYLMVVNAIFTSFPPMILGIFDKDCPSRILLLKPHLYSRGRKSKVYTDYSFWVNIFDALYQSIVMFFVPLIVYYDTDIGIYEFGTIIFTACVLEHLVHISIEYKSWSLLNVIALSFSLFSYLMFAWIYNYFALGGVFTSDAYMVIQNVSFDSRFWVSILSVLVLAPMPRCVVRVMQTSLTPSPITRAVKTVKEWSLIEETDELLNNIPTKKRTMSGVWTKKTRTIINNINKTDKLLDTTKTVSK